ncbi:MAG: tetratricopeptide repeat protein [Myxococcota bacterium]
MTGVGRVLLGLVVAGWLADQLARPDRDVEAGIEAYEADELDTALEHFEAAIARHGDQPELSYDRGLVRLAQGEPDEARRAFERASETEDLEVRASAFYERGNVAFDIEDWDGAIEAYIECLKARPDHSNAKWNLELALQRKQEQEDEQENEDEDDNEDDENEDDGGTGGDETGGDETGGDETGGEDSGGETGGSDSGGEDTGGGDTGGEDSGGEESGGDEGDSGGESGEDQPPEDDGGTGEPPPEQDGGTGGEPPPPPPQPADEMDLQRALDELDEQDQFPLGRINGGQRPPREDW